MGNEGGIDTDDTQTIKNSWDGYHAVALSSKKLSLACTSLLH